MSGVDDNLSVDTRRHFLQALRRVLRPIVRLMIRSGIRYDEFVDVARGAYVESAIRDVDNDAPRPTRDQVAWTTGIQRDLVDHYIDNEEPCSAATPIASHIATEVLHKWHTDRRFLGPSGTPLELDFNAAAGPSFESLVAEVDSQSNSGLILEELLRLRSVVRSDDNHLRAVSRFSIWPNDGQQRIECFGTTLAHMIETFAHNLGSTITENKRLERTVSTDRGISSEILTSFHAFARERGNQFLIDLDDWLGQRSYEIANEVGPRLKIGINIFFYVEPPVDRIPLDALVLPSKTPTRFDGGHG